MLCSCTNLLSYIVIVVIYSTFSTVKAIHSIFPMIVELNELSEVILVFYDNFIKLCTLRGISPSVAAEEIGLDRSAVTGWKKGSKPKDTTIRKIADYFDVSPEELTRSVVQRQQDAHAVVQQNVEHLTDEERHLLAAYRQADEKSRAMVRLALNLDSTAPSATSEKAM